MFKIAYNFGRNLLSYSISNEFQHFFIAENVPDAVTGEYHELMVGREVAHVHVGTRRHDLLLGPLVLVLLEDEIAEGARQRQVAVHTIELDPAASRHDTSRLELVVRLVIVREVLNATPHRHNRSRVTHVTLWIPKTKLMYFFSTIKLRFSLHNKVFGLWLWHKLL